jgi:hypothetical protein
LRKNIFPKKRTACANGREIVSLCSADGKIGANEKKIGLPPLLAMRDRKKLQVEILQSIWTTLSFCKPFFHFSNCISTLVKKETRLIFLWGITGSFHTSNCSV